VSDRVIRVWRALATEAGVEEYLAHFDETVEPSLAAITGFLGSSVLLRRIEGGVEVVVVTGWTSWKAVTAFAGADLDQAIVHPAARALLLDAGERVAHYQVARGPGH
jgi:heme-degrading monooxygenase HmoA